MFSSNTLRIFVAMPGTDMGSNASYKDPSSVKANLLQPVVDRLEAKLGRKVELVIEKDKTQSGVIHASMFGEAYDADVYIADLTGANPNVYLELGVRWALRDGVTIPISQNVSDLRFNVGANRAIIYTPDILMKAVDDIVAAIEDGLRTNRCDSPVRLNNEIIAVPKFELEKLRTETNRLTTARGEDLVRVAMVTTDLNDRAKLLEQAATINPASIDASLELGKVYRDLSRYDEAIETLIHARGLAPNNASVHRELGVCYNKQMKPDFAANALREAVRLAPQDKESWSNLGGALRRLGIASAPHSYDRKALEEALGSYSEAHKLDSFDLYSGLNVARLNVLLSKWDIELLAQAQEGFRKQIDLCRYMVTTNPEAYWYQFDLADALLFSGHYKESYESFTKAIELIPPLERRDKLLSVLGPLQDYLKADVIEGTLRTEVERVVTILESSRLNM
ncbi:tetratricopeptide repeat protein [Oculatella sp. LEGE 06141]|uniref:tetratricopeptide repeat-containing protein n=1 Tax=Oculatella sp. LEGE 06141 TaxID=1828648 RepID=UPI00187DE8C0|nr:tetratricopeptide repeat-containing protein [Oculatella sp. LEGE 06141]MBE9180273.1 tetratricopeptide repeat protein [Oculatella sp. LEGE 06141]